MTVMDTHTFNFYRKSGDPSGTTGTLEHASLNHSASASSGVPVSSNTDSGTGTPEHRSRVALFVSTAVESWITHQPRIFARDVQINDTAYRRLDPEYYAWLRSKMQLAKSSVDAGRLGQDQFQELRCRFNIMHEWAVEHFGESRLLDAIRDLDARGYAPPVAEPDAPSHVPQPAKADLSEALTMVDAIRERALALGWTRESLYAHAGSHRAALGADRGLVCILNAADKIGEVTTHAIKIILPNNVRQHFYNPNVDQPWIRRVR